MVYPLDMRVDGDEIAEGLHIQHEGGPANTFVQTMGRRPERKAGRSYPLT